MLSDLNLTRGTSIYFTHTVPRRNLIDFIKMIIDRSNASKAYSRKTKKSKAVKKPTTADILEKYSEQAKAAIKRIIQRDRCRIEDAIFKYELQERDKNNPLFQKTKG